MLSVTSMKRATLIGAQSQLSLVIEELHSLGVVHIIDHAKTQDLDIGAPLENGEELSRALVQTRSMASHLDIDLKSTPLSKAPQEQLPKGLFEEVTSLLERKRDVEASRRDIQQRLRQFRMLAALDLTSEHVTPYDSLAVFIGTLKAPMERLPGEYELRSQTIDGTLCIALFVPKNMQEKATSALLKQGFTETPITVDTKDAQESARKAEKELERVQSELSDIQQELFRLKDKYAATLRAVEEYLTVELHKAHAPLRFGATEYSFTISGWIPDDKVDSLFTRLEKVTKGAIHIQLEDPDHNDTPPIKLKNSKITKPFEFFMDLYTLPDYKEVDPSFLMLLTFPLFYGFMLGDMGYGLVGLLLFGALRAKIKGDAQRLINALLYASFATIFFGALFGEFFGEEVLFGYALPHVLSRAHQITALMGAAVAIGVAHINIGLMLGWYNEAHHHGFLHGFFAKGSWILLQISGVLAALGFIGVLARPFGFLGIILALLSVVFIYLGEGVRGLVEIPAIISNILSYIRLMAIGISSVLIALIVNNLSKQMFQAGGAMVVAGILLLIVGHSINIALGIMGPFLHSLRLHYVEFFSKFFAGGGKPYSPFGVRED